MSVNPKRIKISTLFTHTKAIQTIEVLHIIFFFYGYLRIYYINFMGARQADIATITGVFLNVSHWYKYAGGHASKANLQ